jgi:hypothetical protein
MVPACPWKWKSQAAARDLNALVVFVVDATKPFSSPATMP